MSYAKLTPEQRRAKLAENCRRYRERHPDRVKAALAAYRDRNATVLRQRCAEWRRANPELSKACVDNWRKTHPERVKTLHDAWFNAHRAEVQAWRRENYTKHSSDLRAKANAERLTRKQELVAMLGGKCTDCGCVPHIAALEFDHVGVKSDRISSLLARSSLWEQAVAEVRQCELVCANCHRIRTANRTGRV